MRRSTTSSRHSGTTAASAPPRRPAGAGTELVDTGAKGAEASKNLLDELAPRRGATILSGVSNLANTILGAGMLGLPHGAKRPGSKTRVLMPFACLREPRDPPTPHRH